MTTINVQFSDNTSATIVSYFSVPQNVSVFANLGEVETSDPRWETYFNTLPASVQSSIPAPTAT